MQKLCFATFSLFMAYKCYQQSKIDTLFVSDYMIEVFFIAEMFQYYQTIQKTNHVYILLGWVRQPQ